MTRLSPARLTGLAALALTTCLCVLPAAAQTFSEEEIKELALQAILENPQIVMEAVAILQAREQEDAAAAARASLDDGRALLERDPNAPVLGNPEGDVTVVEFFDYNCPYCRRAGEQVTAMLERDENVRVVMREWPILGEGSVFAARAALAARAQGKYGEFHDALMGAPGRIDDNTAMQIAAGVGLNLDQLRADMDSPEVQAHIDATMTLAQSLGFSGTPSFVIGSELAPGLIDAEQMLEMIESAREDL